jgi:hypothetical protein
MAHPYGWRRPRPPRPRPAWGASRSALRRRLSLGGTASTWINRDSHFRATRALVLDMHDKKSGFITGAEGGMGVDLATAALAAGHAGVATGRNLDDINEASGEGRG